MAPVCCIDSLLQLRMTPTSIRDSLSGSGTWFLLPKASDVRYLLQDPIDRPHFSLARIALTGLMLVLIVCLGGVGGFFSYQSSSQVGESGPESHALQGDQPLALVRNPEFPGRLWRGEKPNSQSGERPEVAGDEFINLTITVDTCLYAASIEPAIFINLPVPLAQVVPPQQPRAPPEALPI